MYLAPVLKQHILLLYTFAAKFNNIQCHRAPSLTIIRILSQTRTLMHYAKIALTDGFEANVALGCVLWYISLSTTPLY